MSSHISYIKGVRTRYVNALKSELKRGFDFLGIHHECSTLTECINFRKQVSECMCKIESYNEKLINQSDKLAQALDEKEAELIKSILDEDTVLIDEAMSTSIQLHDYIESLKDCEKKESAREADKFSDCMSHFSKDVQKAFENQMALQKDLLEKMKDKEKSSSSVKLPKLDINSFNGNKLNWSEFWDAYVSAIHKNDKLSGVEKFNYLRSKLTGEARHAIAGLALTEENYSIAIGILRDRYGDKQEMIDLHYKRIMDLNTARNTTESLRFFIDKVEKHLRSLDVLKQDVNQEVFVSMIKRKLPSDVLFQLEILKGKEKKWSVSILREVLWQYITAKEAAEKSDGFVRKQIDTSNRFHQQTPSYSVRAAGSNNSRRASGGVLVADEKQKPHRKESKIVCRYCGKDHWSDVCQNFRTIDERKKCIKGSCYRCLKEGHMANDCKSSKSCVYCGQVNVHHRSLCDKKFRKSDSREAMHLLVETESAGNISEQCEKEPELLSCNESVMMQTATTEVKAPGGEKCENVRIILDSGSHRTYVTEELARRLGLKEEEEQEIQMVTFGSKNTKIIKTRSTKLEIRLKDGRYMILSANIIPNITGTIHRNTVHFQSPKKFAELTRNLSLADTIPTQSETIKLDLLIGNDFYLDITRSEKIEVQPGLYLLSSCLGWILTGRTQSKEQAKTNDMNMLILTYGNNVTETSVFASVDDTLHTKPDIEDFWNLEAIGIIDNVDKSGDEIAMSHFKETVKRSNIGRYEVTWPWKDEFPELPANRGLAIGRFRSLSGKLQRQPELMEKYDSVIQDQLDKGIIEKVERTQSDGMKHYIPHHVVITPEKSTTKLRIVYDASAKTKKEHKSLNECLYRGPVLLRDLCGILLRFRLHKIGMVSDIEKAFLQIGLQTQERDVTRFLWFKNYENPVVDESNIQEYRFCRVPFGVISSPFLLGATIEHHLDSYSSLLAGQLKEDIYMDNVITGEETVKGAIDLYRNAKSIFSEAKMNLRQWITNNEDVNNEIPEDDKDKDKNVKVLGHNWSVEDDTLNVSKVKILSKDFVLTKRNVLKQLASVFDPLGIFSPVILRGKTLIQRIWIKKLDWDDPLDEEDSKEWQDVKSDLKDIESVKLDRRITQLEGDNEVRYSLLCFTDASKKAYAAVVYVVKEVKDDIKCDLVFAKSRLAPVKEISIPRLELMAALIGVRCVKFVIDQMRLPFKNVYMMIDSMCVLQWISSEKVLPVFVKNRVNEIRSHTGVKFCHVDSQSNPADVASRGCTLHNLREDHNWWNGPSSLKDLMKNPEFEIQNSVDDNSKDNGINSKGTEDTAEVKDVGDSCGNTKKVEYIGETNLISGNTESEIDTPFGIDIEKFSTASRLFRVTAWCHRFVSKTRGISKEQGCLTSEELDHAEKSWLKRVQRKHFGDLYTSISDRKPNTLARQLGLYVDRDGLVRCFGRLENSNLCEAAKFPILLPRKDRLTYLLIERVHSNILHSGISQTLSEIRMKYWIPHGRATVRSRLKLCKVCRRAEGGPYKLPNMPPFPESRVTHSMPFSKVGVDYMGPLYVKESNGISSKVWICLFTCLSTRAIHLELVQDMSARSFIHCLRRFIATRGTPSEIISDNAKHFKLTDETIRLIWSDTIHSSDVQNYVSNENIRWSFIVELAPWMGGFYERLVGIVKRSLRKTIGKKLLTMDQMLTVLKEVESVVNKRPLVYVGDDLNSSIVITPGHFLCLNPKTGIPELPSDDENDSEYKPCESTAEKLLHIWKKGEKLLNCFWKIWINEYLLNLRERSQYRIKCSRVQANETPSIGDVVLIKEELPRGQWKLGKLIHLRVSRDGNIRSAQVTTASGKVLNRPLNLLYPIEVSYSQKQVNGTCDKVQDNSENSDSRPTRKAALKARELVKKML